MKLEVLEKELKYILNEGFENQYYQIDNSIRWDRELSINDSKKGVIHSFGSKLYIEKSEGKLSLHYDIINSYENSKMIPVGMDTLISCPYDKNDTKGSIKKFIEKVHKIVPWILD